MLTVELRVPDHKAYYPGAHDLRLRITGDRETGRLLGAQILGHWQAEVAKRIDIFATALFHGMLVDQLNELDLAIRRRCPVHGTRCSSPRRPGQRHTGAVLEQLAACGLCTTVSTRQRRLLRDRTTR